LHRGGHGKDGSARFLSPKPVDCLAADRLPDRQHDRAVFAGYAESQRLEEGAQDGVRGVYRLTYRFTSCSLRDTARSTAREK
jgi:hypothetical protein